MGMLESPGADGRSHAEDPRKILTARTGLRVPTEFQDIPCAEVVLAKPLPCTKNQRRQQAPPIEREAVGVWAVVKHVRYKRGFAFLKVSGISIYLSLSLFPEYQSGKRIPMGYGDRVDCEIESKPKGLCVKKIFAIQRT